MMLGNWDLVVFFNTEISEVRSFTERGKYFSRTAMILNVAIKNQTFKIPCLPTGRLVQYSLFFSLPKHPLPL